MTSYLSRFISRSIYAIKLEVRKLTVGAYSYILVFPNTFFVKSMYTMLFYMLIIVHTHIMVYDEHTNFCLGLQLKKKLLLYLDWPLSYTIFTYCYRYYPKSYGKLFLCSELLRISFSVFFFFYNTSSLFS